MGDKKLAQTQQRKLKSILRELGIKSKEVLTQD
jgi:hypothetical protein